MHFIFAGLVLTAFGVWKGFEVHAHRCPTCGSVWTHNGFNFGGSTAHTCSKCGALQWVPLPDDAWHFGADGTIHLVHASHVEPPLPPPTATPPASKPS
jgi:hypothetical protein